ncbi:MAG: DUF4276 family protein [Candidatus Bipolaricaulia bacterium]
MISEIRIYIEGGGDYKDTKARMRQGFGNFLEDLRHIARSRRIRWQIIACGPRNDAHNNFLMALETHPDAFNVLLVDSEGPVDTSPCKHLEIRDGWSLPGVDDAHCHLMVQIMEAWLVADIDTLSDFYGHRFNPNPIPKNPNVEEIDRNSRSVCATSGRTVHIGEKA